MIQVQNLLKPNYFKISVRKLQSKVKKTLDISICRTILPSKDFLYTMLMASEAINANTFKDVHILNKSPLIIIYEIGSYNEKFVFQKIKIYFALEVCQGSGSEIPNFEFQKM